VFALLVVKMADQVRIGKNMAVSNSQPFEVGDPFFGQKLQRRKFILCFDGTGNKFQGNEGDSNSRWNIIPRQRLELKYSSLEDLLDA
jgi:hypothetical protein